LIKLTIAIPLLDLRLPRKRVQEKLCGCTLARRGRFPRRDFAPPGLPALANLVTSPLVEAFFQLEGDDRGASSLQDEWGARSFTELIEGALRARAALCRGARSLEGARVAILASPGTRWVEA
jgi:hypothetical protein